MRCGTFTQACGFVAASILSPLPHAAHRRLFFFVLRTLVPHDACPSGEGIFGFASLLVMCMLVHPLLKVLGPSQRVSTFPRLFCNVQCDTKSMKILDPLVLNSRGSRWGEGLLRSCRPPSPRPAGGLPSPPPRPTALCWGGGAPLDPHRILRPGERPSGNCVEH